MGNFRAADGTVDIYCACHEKLVVVHADGTLDVRAAVSVDTQIARTIVVCRKCGDHTDIWREAFA